MGQGQFITIEGGEGSGKSTQLALLMQAFEAADLPVIRTREPGGTVGAEAIRDLLVQGDVDRWDPISETLLFYAARRELMTKEVWPANASGTHVVCDRWADSTRVYQGYGKEMGQGFVQAVHHLTLGDCEPDLTLWLDIDVQAGLARANGGPQENETRFEGMQQSFHQRVREGFAQIAKREPERFIRIDAGQTIETVHAAMIAAINNHLGLQLHPAIGKEAAHG